MKYFVIILLIMSTLALKAQHIQGSLYKSGTSSTTGPYIRSTDVKFIKAVKPDSPSTGKPISDKPFTVNPNPVAEKMHLINDYAYKIINVSILDAQGKLLFQSNLASQSNLFELNLTALTSGNYILKITFNKEKETVDSFSINFVKI